MSSSADELLERFEKSKASLSAYLYVILRNWAWVEDALQDSALYLSNNWQDFEEGTNFNAWIKTIARFRAKEILAREKRQDRIALRMADRMPVINDQAVQMDADISIALEKCLKFKAVVTPKV